MLMKMAIEMQGIPAITAFFRAQMANIDRLACNAAKVLEPNNGASIGSRLI
jgi:hypothetical protein